MLIRRINSSMPLIARNPNTAAATMRSASAAPRCFDDLAVDNDVFQLERAEPTIAGIDIKNEKSAERLRVRPLAKPAEIVEPERESPEGSRPLHKPIATES